MGGKHRQQPIPANIFFPTSTACFCPGGICKGPRPAPESEAAVRRISQDDVQDCFPLSTDTCGKAIATGCGFAYGPL